MYEPIKERLIKLVTDRNYFFRQTSKADAEAYLTRKIAFHGISQEEILRLQSQFSFTFPEDFVQYLLQFGKNSGELFCLGQDLDYRAFDDYQRWMKELQSFHSKEEQLFVFNEHQGYAVYYFCKKTNGDISVYSYAEGEPRKIATSFTALLELEVRKLEKAHQLGKTTDGHILILQDGYEQRHYGNHPEGMSPRAIGDIFLEDEIQDPFIIYMKKIMSN